LGAGKIILKSVKFYNLNFGADDIRQSPNWGKYLKRLGWETEIIEKTIQIRIRKLPFIGSIIKIQRPNNINQKTFNQIDTLAKKHRAIFVKVEPTTPIKPLKDNKYHSDSWPTLPSKTILIDLKTEPKYAKDTKQSIKKAKNANVKVKFFDPADIDAQKICYKILKDTAKVKGFFFPSLEKDTAHKFNAFKNSGIIAIAYLKQRPVAACFVAIFKNSANYVHAGSTKEGKTVYAPYLIMDKLIKTLSLKKLEIFDLEGIYDPRYPKFTKQWKKFSVFKRKWGGKEIEYPGSYIKIYPKLLKIIL